MKKNLLMIEIKNRIFRMVLFLSAISFFMISIVNIINQRPASNVFLPLTASVVISSLIWLYKQERYRLPIKYSYLFLLNVVYLPMAWLSSPGSYSAMSFYAVLIVFVGIISALYIWDYTFPAISVLEVLFLLNYEPKFPEQFTIYSALEMRAIDLSINFVIVAIIIFAIIYVVNSYFDSEHKRVYSLSITDQLTGIYNRRYLYTQLENYGKHQGTLGPTFTILMMDLDNFKKINDNYGHLEGDEVLKEFGRVINSACRKIDLPARYGGDEFVIVLPETTEKDTEIIKSRIIDLFSETLKKYESINLSISFGIATSQGKSIEEVMQHADDHLYKSKSELKKIQT